MLSRVYTRKISNLVLYQWEGVLFFKRICLQMLMQTPPPPPFIPYVKSFPYLSKLNCAETIQENVTE